jgi:hypothetical protein
LCKWNERDQDNTYERQAKSSGNNSNYRQDAMAMMDDKETSDVGGEMCVLTDPAWATSVSTVTGMNLSCAFRHTFGAFMALS